PAEPGGPGLPGAPGGPAGPGPGGVFVTGRKTLWEVGMGPNQAGAASVVHQAVAYVTGNEPAPRILLVASHDCAGHSGCVLHSRPEDVDGTAFWDTPPDGGTGPDPDPSRPESAEYGMRQSGFAYCGAAVRPPLGGCFDVADHDGVFGTLDMAKVLDDDRTNYQFDLDDYHAVVVAHDTWNRVMQILERAGPRLRAYVNSGHGLVGFAPGLRHFCHDRRRGVPPGCASAQAAGRLRYLDWPRPESQDHYYFLEWTRYLPFLDFQSFGDDPKYCARDPRTRNGCAASPTGKGGGLWPPYSEVTRATPAAMAMGITDADVNPAWPLAYFPPTPGFDPIEVDLDGNIITMATRRPIPGGGPTGGGEEEPEQPPEDEPDEEARQSPAVDPKAGGPADKIADNPPPPPSQVQPQPQLQAQPQLQLQPQVQPQGQEQGQEQGQNQGQRQGQNQGQRQGQSGPQAAATSERQRQAQPETVAADEPQTLLASDRRQGTGLPLALGGGAVVLAVGLGWATRRRGPLITRSLASEPSPGATVPSVPSVLWDRTIRHHLTLGDQTAHGASGPPPP
ncbi:MAG TPA: hypothetical protein VEI97_01825, partial [bacterium]|nr:hypothetical protein [bacterium]